MTRVAAGHPGIWPDICAENATAIVDALDALVDRSQRHARPGGRPGPRRPSSARSRRPARPGATCPARAVRPDHLAELRIPVPDRDGVLAEITSLAADAGIGIYDIEIAHSAEGPAWRPDPRGRRRRRRHPHGRPWRHPATAAGRSSCRDGAARPRRRRWRALPRHGAHARREVDLAPLRPARRAWPKGPPSSTGSPTAPTWPPRWPRWRRWGRAWSAAHDGTRRPPRRAEPAPPARRASRLWQLGDVHAPAGRPGGRVRLGDRAGRVTTRSRRGPMDRVAEPLGLMGATVTRPGRALPAAAAGARAARCAASTGPPRWPARR